MKEWLSERLGIVAVRQLADRVRHQLSFVPGLYVLAGLVLSQFTLAFDRALREWNPPEFLATTVDSARAVFTVIAGGLITAITLLLSMTLVAVQLASSNFSPRTLREWLSDRRLQHTIGLALGTTVFCLLAIGSTRSLPDADGESVVPHLSVLLAIALGVASLFAVVRSVDHTTHSLRVGSLAQRIANDTLAVIEAQSKLTTGPKTAPAVPSTSPAVGTRSDDVFADIPEDAFAVEARDAGWVQQINAARIVEALPEHTTAYVVVPLGAYVPTHLPLMWVAPAPTEESTRDQCVAAGMGGIAIGDSRTLQQDSAFGIMQLTDIAVRALSPGVNDPSTACDVVVHLGNVMISIWAEPVATTVAEEGSRTVVMRQPAHADQLTRAFDPIRRYGRHDPSVTATLLRTLHTIRSEVIRRELPGPLGPIESMIIGTADRVDAQGWSPEELVLVRRLSSVGV